MLFDDLSRRRQRRPGRFERGEQLLLGVQSSQPIRNLLRGGAD
jgi:hypothetical protein